MCVKLERIYTLWVCVGAGRKPHGIQFQEQFTSMTRCYSFTPRSCLVLCYFQILQMLITVCNPPVSKRRTESWRRSIDRCRYWRVIPCKFIMCNRKMYTCTNGLNSTSSDCSSMEEKMFACLFCVMFTRIFCHAMDLKLLKVLNAVLSLCVFMSLRENEWRAVCVSFIASFYGSKHHTHIESSLQQNALVSFRVDDHSIQYYSPKNLFTAHIHKCSYVVSHNSFN